MTRELRHCWRDPGCISGILGYICSGRSGPGKWPAPGHTWPADLQMSSDYRRRRRRASLLVVLGSTVLAAAAIATALLG